MGETPVRVWSSCRPMANRHEGESPWPVASPLLLMFWLGLSVSADALLYIYIHSAEGTRPRLLSLPCCASSPCSRPLTIACVRACVRACCVRACVPRRAACVRACCVRACCVRACCVLRAAACVRACCVPCCPRRACGRRSSLSARSEGAPLSALSAALRPRCTCSCARVRYARAACVRAACVRACVLPRACCVLRTAACVRACCVLAALGASARRSSLSSRRALRARRSLHSARLCGRAARAPALVCAACVRACARSLMRALLPPLLKPPPPMIANTSGDGEAAAAKPPAGQR